MRHFENEVLAQAARLRSRSAPLPEWLALAKSAMLQWQEGPGDPRALAEALGAIPGWPANEAAARAELDELARPVADLLSKTLCRVGPDAYGEPAALLWGGAAKVKAGAGGAALLGSSAGAEALWDADFFERAAPPKPQSAKRPAPPRESAREALARLEAQGEGFLEDIARDKGLTAAELSARDRRLHDQVNLELSRGLAPSPQVLLMSDGELIERGDYERHGPQAGSGAAVRAIEGVAGAPAAPGADASAELGRVLMGVRAGASAALDEFRAAALKSAMGAFSSVRVGRASAGEAGAAERGFERGEALLRAAQEAGDRAWAQARAMASERLTGFLKSRGLAPKTAPSAEGVRERLLARRDPEGPKAAPKPRGGL